MALRKFLVISSLLLLSSCTSWTEERIDVAVTSDDQPVIARAEKPKQIDLNSVEWFVVTSDNIEDFKAELIELQGEYVFYAMIPKAYENMAINMDTILQYILKQKAIIQYYEDYLYKDDTDTTEQ